MEGKGTGWVRWTAHSTYDRRMRMIGDIIAEKGHLKTQINKWEEIVDNIDSAVRKVNEETKVIKYNDVPSNIYFSRRDCRHFGNTT